MFRTLARTLGRMKIPSLGMQILRPVPLVMKCHSRFSTQPRDNNNTLNFIFQKSLKTIQINNYTAELTEQEKKMPVHEFCLFSSVQPIFPNNQMTCSIRIGNPPLLFPQGNLKKITKPLLYTTIAPENGEIFTVGILLGRSVERNLNSELKLLEQRDANGNILIGDSYNHTFNLDIVSKPKNYRFKIIKIQMTPDGIFAQGIPYKDRPLNETEQNFNIQHEIRLISNLVHQIKKVVAYDRIEAFQEVKLNLLETSDKLSPSEVDELVYQVALGLSKLQNSHLKVGTVVFVQQLIESETYIERLLLVRRQLELTAQVMELVNKHFKEADQSMMKLHQQTLAKLATEYIRQNYLREPIQQPHFGGSIGQGPAGEKTKQSASSKKYFDKLHLIEDEASREKVRKEIERFSQLDRMNTEYHKIMQYLDEVFSIPFNKYTNVQWDVNYAQEVLDKEIEGLERVKERIIEMIAVNKLKNSGPKSKGFILLLNGPPGTGKTSIAKSIAKSLQRTSRFISCAGVADPTFFKGHKRTYVDSMPGIFIRELIKANSMNPVFILDELDKVSKHHAGGADPYYTLLEILNPEENHNFTDHYMDIAVDFSHVIFILTSNETLQMLEPLKNRLETIEIQAYIQEQKLQIAQNFLVTKSLESNGIQPNLIRYDQPTLTKIIKGWCYQESGVRELKRSLEKIARKHATALLQQHPQVFEQSQKLEQPEQKDKEEITQEQISKLNTEQKQIILNYDTSRLQVLDLTRDQNLEILQQYLGPPILDIAIEQRSKKVFPSGQINILTVGGMIGHVLTVECCFDDTELDKKGQITASGNIKTVLQESLKLAKINAFKYLTEEQKQLVRDRTIHCHFTEGATPKDGPSAGTAITTALISLASNRKVPSNLAMTGEISLNGLVCKIGGVQQKLIAAKTLEIVDIILPYANMGETLDLPRQLLKGLNLYFVTEYSQIFKLIFEKQMEMYKDSSRFYIDDVHVFREGVLHRPQNQSDSYQYVSYQQDQS